MNWKNIEDGYEFRIHFQHGQHSSRVVETINCSLDEIEFNKVYKIVSHLREGIEKCFESYTEKVAEHISNKTGINEKEVMKIIEQVVRSDIRFEGYMAHLDFFEVYRFEGGKVQKNS